MANEPHGFWMLLSDVLKLFNRVEVIHLDEENSKIEPSLSDKVTWQMQVHQGSWKRGITAGGCKNNIGQSV